MATLIGPVSDWAKSELEDCFSGVDLDIEGEFYLEEDDDSGYVEGVTINGQGANLYGQLDVFGSTAHRVSMAIRIENANSVEDLPEGLSSEDEDIRNLAKDRLEDLVDEASDTSDKAKEILDELDYEVDEDA